ncbi:MAG: aldehyde dehydrogenase family protein [Solirubrobacteraceae bacterium]
MAALPDVGALPSETTPAQLATVAAGAATASRAWGRAMGVERARALSAAADALDEAVDELVAAADAETALGDARLRGEVARTTGQLRMFAELVARGAELDAIVSEADAGRPDLRRMLQPIGPVAVFAASNFPFAFSVAGGDTASALAAGCAVIVKAHEGHPRTSALTTAVVASALAAAGAPDGTLQTVYGLEAGRRLVVEPAVRAIGFTGSLAGGRALLALTQTRPDPIPFYGELGSVNPVIVLPRAGARRAAEIAHGYVQSLTLGVGQFCTNPGLLIVPDDAPLLQAIAEAASLARGGTMLTERIFDQFERSVADPAWSSLPELARGSADGERAAVPQVRRATLAQLRSDLEQLARERFGPAGLVVTYDDPERLLEALALLPGTLATAVHAEPDEHDLASRIAGELAGRAGRLIFNGWPTGVAVCWAMHHGGPWPASTAPATTSVGATAIRRWLAPVAWQDWPDDLLPEALRRDNPLGLERLTER